MVDPIVSKDFKQDYRNRNNESSSWDPSGNSLLLLLFVITTASLSTLLNKNDLGFRIENEHESISHLTFMDDQKLIVPSQNKLNTLLKSVKTFSNDVKLYFSLGKCATATSRKRETFDFKNLTLNKEDSIRLREREDVYKHLGLIRDQEQSKLLLKRHLSRTRYWSPQS